MENKHIQYFKVENFKRFTSLELKDIGQFNLIVGDNNVGKTSVLEALLFDEDAATFAGRLKYLLANIKKFTNLKESYLDFFINRNNPKWFDLTICRFIINPNDLYPELNYVRGQSRLLWKKLANAAQDFQTNNNVYNINFPFLPATPTYTHELTELYAKHIQEVRSRKLQFINDLKIIVPNIESIEVSSSTANENVLRIQQNDREDVMPLAMFGDGIIKLFRVLIEIIVNQGNRLMIDEIDAGLHYSRMKDFWRTILKSAQANKVQLFITTHNLECLTYFKEVLEEPEMQEFQALSRCFALKELPNREVKAYNYSFEDFENAIDTETEMRGGRR